MDQPRHLGALSTRSADTRALGVGALRRAAAALGLALAFALVLAPAVMAAAARVAPAAAPATRSVYRLAYASTTHSDLRALFGLPAQAGAEPAGLVHDIDSRLDGELERVALNVAGERLLALRLRGPRVALRIDGADASAQAGVIAAQLASATLLATLDADGLVTGLRVPPGMDEQSMAYARALVGALQFSRPRGGASRWETREDDQAGSYRARYLRSRDAVVRTRIAYEPARVRAPGEPGVSQLIEPGGSARARFSRGGELLALDGAETQRVSVASKPIATGTTSVQLRRMSSEALDDAARKAQVEAALAFAHESAPERLSAAAEGSSSDQGMHRQELADDTLDTLLARLHEQASEPQGSTKATALYLKFKALVALQPETSARLGAELGNAAPGSAAMLTLAQALGAVGHSRAQEALVAAIRQRANDWPALASLLPVLGSVREPTAASVEALQAIAGNATDASIASTARLALGTLARTSAAAMPERSAALVAALRARLAQARSERERRDYLLALGNAASVAAEDDALRFAHDPAPDVRSAAIAALRWVDTAPARAQLLSTLSVDEDPGVRGAAAQALGAQGMDAASFAAQRRAFAVDPDEQVRVALLHNLWAAVAGFAEARTIVEAARKDSSKAVRNAAERMH